ncbi:MAG: hypothetical protein ACK41D_12575 [Rubricoccaceae bacterium]
MHALRLTLLVLLVPVTLVACGNTDDPEADDAGRPGLTDIVRGATQAQSALEQLAARAEQPPAEPVDFRVLRDRLPGAVAGLERTDVQGARQGAMGFTVSEATATYAGPDGDDGPPTLVLKIQDLGGAQMALMMGLAWTMAEVDRETSTGFERTMRLDGHPGYEEHDAAARTGKVQVLVADRFLVEAQGRLLESDALRAAVRSVNLAALEQMRDEGRAGT